MIGNTYMKIDNRYNNNFQNLKSSGLRHKSCLCFGEQINESTDKKSDIIANSYAEFCKKWFTPRDAYTLRGTLSLGGIIILVAGGIIGGSMALFRKYKIMGFK
jgi:hypothetical protein